jgi:hypothetical protein
MAAFTQGIYDDPNAGALAPSSPDSFDDAVKSSAAATKKLQEADEAAANKLSTSAAETKEKIGQLENLADGLHPPVMQLIPPPQPQSTNPLQQWGSAAMIFAALGSLLTRTPATTAMNAAAAVMNGYRQRDQVAADQAFETWKVASDNAIKMHNYQMEVYNSILAQIGRKEDVASKEFGMDEAAAKVQLSVAAKALNDPIAAQVAQDRGLEAFAHLQETRQKAADNWLKGQKALIEQKMFRDSYAQLTQTPEYQKASPMQKLAMTYALMSKVAPSADNRGNGDPKDITAARAAFNEEYVNPQTGGPYDKFVKRDPQTGKVKSTVPDFFEWYKNTWPTLFTGGASETGVSPGADSGATGSTAPLQSLPDPLNLH